MSNKTTVGILIALIALLGVFYYVTNLGTPKPPPPPPPITSAQMWQKTLALVCKPARGNPAATWTVVEIGDFQCPICGRSRKYAEALIDKSNGLAKLYFMNYPLDMHEYARPAAMASIAAEKQGKFWAMYDQLYEHQANLNPSGILDAATKAGLNIPAFEKSLRSPGTGLRMADQHGMSDRLGVQATPTFLVHQDGSKTFKVYVGMWPESNLGNEPGLRQLMLDTPWGVKMSPADIPPAKAPSK